jgi:hypothetical protein
MIPSRNNKDEAPHLLTENGPNSPSKPYNNDMSSSALVGAL